MHSTTLSSATCSTPAIQLALTASGSGTYVTSWGLWGGEKTYFEHLVVTGGLGRVRIGRSYQINENCFIQESEIGNHVMIPPSVAIISTMHRRDRTDVPMVMQGDTPSVKVVIEDDAWIGRNALVMPGVRIGKGSIVAAGAVVSQDVPVYRIIGDVPTKIIRGRRV